MIRTTIIFGLLCAVNSVLAQPSSSFFVPNQGQWDGDFLFLYQGHGITYFITRTGMTLDFREPVAPHGSALREPVVPHGSALGEPVAPHSGARFFSPSGVADPAAIGTVRGHVLRLSFIDANPSLEVVGQDKLSSYSNYFLGRDSCRWRSFVPNYQGVAAREVWPGIDVEYLAHEDGVETLFRVKPGADVSRITLEYEGPERPLEVDALGNLLLHTSLGAVKEKAPWAYQIVGSRRAEVPVSFHVLSSTRYGLTLGQYDASQELVIDPRVIYSTYFGWGGWVGGISLDSEGNVVIVGTTPSPNFPVTPGAYQESLRGSGDAFLSKLRPDGHSFAYSTYIGGIAGSEALGPVVVDGQDRMLANGSSFSEDWPLTNGAFDTIRDGEYESVFVCFSADGSELLYSTYMGGPGNDFAGGMSLDTLSGEMYVCGLAGEGFPVTPDAVYPTRIGNCSFVYIFDPSVMQIVYSTYFPAAREEGLVEVYCVVPVGGRIVWLAGDTYGDGALVTPDAFQSEFGGGGWDDYFARCDLTGAGVTYGSYIGGSDDEMSLSLLVHPSGQLLLCGWTRSADFPVTLGAFDTTYGGYGDVFASILEPPGTLLHSTFLGGDWTDQGAGAVLTASGDVLLVGSTQGLGFPLTPDAFDTSAGQEWRGDGFVCRLSPDLSRVLFSTYWGGDSGTETMGRILLEGQDSIWVTGATHSTDYSITPDAIQPYGSWESYLAHFFIGPGSGTGRTRPALLAPNELTLTCYPNPFNATAILRFTLPRAGSARLLVYDLLGRKVLDEILGRLPAGEHRHTLDASDLPSGVYFARLEALGLERVQKMVVLR